MQTAGYTKVGAAFLAGIVVALGGALIYLKVSDARVPTPVSVAAVQDNAPVQPEVSAAEPPPKPAEVAVVPSEKPSVVHVPLVHSPVVHIQARTSSRPVSLAVPRYKVDPVQEPIAETLPPPSLEPPTPGPMVTTPVAPAPQPHTVTIPAGTSLAVRMNEKLSTEHNFSGDTFRASLDSPIVMDGFIIADRGAKVLGRVVRAQKPGKLQGMAELSLVLTEIATTDGQRMQVETNESLRKGPSNTNEEVVKMAGAAALGAIIGAIAGGGKGAAIGAGAGGAAGTGAVLLGKGKPAVIANETRLTFELANPSTITERLN